MSYTLLASISIAAVVVADLWVLRTRLLCRRSFWVSYVIILFFQLLGNGVLTGLAIVQYDPHTILGLRIVYAPVEDLAFGFALIPRSPCRAGYGSPRPAGQLRSSGSRRDYHPAAAAATTRAW